LLSHSNTTHFPYTTLFRSYQSASLRSSFGRSAKSRPQEGGHQAKGNLLRSLHALEGTQLRIRLSTRRSASRGSKIIFRRNAGGQDRKSTRLNSSHQIISYA